MTSHAIKADTMAIASCRRCLRFFNASHCPECGDAASFDERFDEEKEVTEADIETWKSETDKAEADKRAYDDAILLSKIAARKAPLGYQEISAASDNISWAIAWCREASDAKEIIETLQSAKRMVLEIEHRLRTETRNAYFVKQTKKESGNA